MLGFDTIGSATILAYDGEPILSTDAWINDSAYFGSWAHDFTIPSEQLDAIRRSKFHFMSHGHPDHLNVESLPDLGPGKILIGDHRGERIRKDLVTMGYNVRVLPTNEWVSLSPRIRVRSFPNENQDTVLLIEVGDVLLVNANDSPDFGWSYTIRRIAKRYRNVFLAQLCGWSGADMCNLFRPDGSWLVAPQDRPTPIGPRLQNLAALYGAHHAIPFSSFHRYQRTDSVWANSLVPDLSDYSEGAHAGRATILPAFVRVNAVNADVTELRPAQKVLVPKAPELFGDNWSDPLEADEIVRLKSYFQRKEMIRPYFRFARFKVGGKETEININPAASAGITFEVPRGSLMTAIDYEIFDDLLIGNFMKVTLHGCESLYPDFTPHVAKVADNGRSESFEEVKAYKTHYFHEDRLGHMFKWAESSAEGLLRRAVPVDSFLFKNLKRTYHHLRG